MQRNTLVRLASCLVLAVGALAHAGDAKVDPNGTWKWSYTTQNGQSREGSLVLKMEGDKLTGKIAGRNGDTDITDAKLKGDEVTFAVTREFNGNSFTQKYQGKISGDSIKGKIETVRDGETISRDWDAKREVKKEETKPSGAASP